jgi:hypothetical protein
MKFWKWLRWVGALLFIAIVLTAWLASDKPAAQSIPTSQEPPPAPTFR